MVAQLTFEARAFLDPGGHGVDTNSALVEQFVEEVPDAHAQVLEDASATVERPQDLLRPTTGQHGREDSSRVARTERDVILRGRLAGAPHDEQIA